MSIKINDAEEALNHVLSGKKIGGFVITNVQKEKCNPNLWTFTVEINNNKMDGYRRLVLDYDQKKLKKKQISDLSPKEFLSYAIEWLNFQRNTIYAVV